MNRQQQAKDNRLLMPVCSAFIDSMREEFGADQVKVKFASENGMTLGRSDSVPTEPMSAPPADLTIQQSIHELNRKIARS